MAKSSRGSMRSCAQAPSSPGRAATARHAAARMSPTAVSRLGGMAAHVGTGSRSAACNSNPPHQRRPGSSPASAASVWRGGTSWTGASSLASSASGAGSGATQANTCPRACSDRAASPCTLPWGMPPGMHHGWRKCRSGWAVLASRTSSGSNPEQHKTHTATRLRRGWWLVAHVRTRVPPRAPEAAAGGTGGAGGTAAAAAATAALPWAAAALGAPPSWAAPEGAAAAAPSLSCMSTSSSRSPPGSTSTSMAPELGEECEGEGEVKNG